MKRLSDHAATIWLGVVILAALLGWIGTGLALILAIFVLLLFIEGHLRQLVKLKRQQVDAKLLIEDNTHI